MTTLTLEQAAEKYGIEKKRLIGFCARNDFSDSLVVDRDENGEYLVADDWRLQMLQLVSPGQSHKSEAQP